MKVYDISGAVGAAYSNPEHTEFDVTLNGDRVHANAIPGLLLFDGLIAAGIAIAPYVPPVPASVTPRQARLALLQAGLLTQVQTSVDAADDATKITWDYATEILRTDPLIVGIGAALGLTPEQIDALFVRAASL